MHSYFYHSKDTKRWIAGVISDEDGSIRVFDFYPTFAAAQHHVDEIKKWWPGARVFDSRDLKISFQLVRPEGS